MENIKTTLESFMKTDRFMNSNSVKKQHISNTKERDATIDIAKAIGIISIVLGHACFYNENVKDVRHFVYIYHILVFVFCLGYLFKNYSYKVFFKKKIIQLYLPLIAYNFVFIIIRPLLFDWGLEDEINWSKPKTILNIISGYHIKGAGALWFVPYLFIISLVLLTIYKISSLFVHKNIIFIILSVFCGVIGRILLSHIDYSNHIIKTLDRYHIVVALVSIPFATLGYYAKKNKWISKIYFVWPIAMGILIAYCCFTDEFLDLYGNKLIKGFYVIVTIGIFFVFGVSFMLSKTRRIKELSSIIGQSSFSIMATHLVVFKLIDAILYYILRVPTNNLNRVPISYPQFWYMYTLASIVIIVLIRVALMKLIKRIKNKVTIWRMSNGQIKNNKM